MPDKSTTQDKKTTVPVTCQQCGKITWHKTEDWPPPVLCPMCEAVAADSAAADAAFAQAMAELFDA